MDTKIIFFDIDGTLIDMKKKQITERMLDTLRRLRERGILLAIAMNRPIAVATKNRMAASGTEPDLEEYYGSARLKLEVAEDFDQVAQEDVYQILAACRKEDYVRMMKDVKGAKITSWWDRAVDIIPSASGKGRGIAKVLEYYHLDRSQAMAFGDGNNDIEMLEAVGTGVAMANGSDDLKAVADEICGDVTEDGIYHRGTGEWEDTAPDRLAFNSGGDRPADHLFV